MATITSSYTDNLILSDSISFTVVTHVTETDNLILYADNLILSDSIKIRRYIKFTDNLILSDSPILLQNKYIKFSDDLILSDGISIHALHKIKFTDNLILSDESKNKYSPHLHYHDPLNLYDNIHFKVFTNGQLQNYSSNDTWVVNSNTNAFSRFTNYDFNSFMKVGDKYYGANDNGLFDLTTYTNKDDTLEYIPTKIKTGLLNVGNGSRVTIPAVFISANNDGPITVNVSDYKGQPFSYEAINTTDSPFEKRAELGRGFYQPYYQFEITNGGVTNFEIYALALQAYITNRRS